MLEWVVDGMYKKDPTGKEVKIQPYSRENVDELLKRYGIVLKNKFGYDYVFAANMCKADYLSSSVSDEQHLALFVKDYVDDPDGYPELPFTRFYSDCIGKGIPIPWQDVL